MLTYASCTCEHPVACAYGHLIAVMYTNSEKVVLSEDVVDHHSYVRNLSSCEIEA